MRPRLAGAIVTALLLAGCSDSAVTEAPGATVTTGPRDLGPGLAMAPVVVGDWWNYTVTSPAGESQVTFVVNADDDAAWRIDTDSGGSAFRDARFDTSFVGPTRKADLAGKQRDTWIEFFRWPLQSGASWTTTWDGLPKTVTVHRLAGTVANLVAKNGTETYATYTYDAGPKWFSELTFFRPNGEVQVHFKLARWGSGYTGDLVRMKVETALDWRGPLTEAPQLKTFPVGPEVTDVYFELRADCTQGTYELLAGKITGNADQGVAPGGGTAQPCPARLSLNYTVVTTPQDDRLWGVIGGGGPASTGTFSALAITRVIEHPKVGG